LDFYGVGSYCILSGLSYLGYIGSGFSGFSVNASYDYFIILLPQLY